MVDDYGDECRDTVEALRAQLAAAEQRAAQVEVARDVLAEYIYRHATAEDVDALQRRLDALRGEVQP